MTHFWMSVTTADNLLLIDSGSNVKDRHVRNWYWRTLQWLNPLVTVTVENSHHTNCDDLVKEIDIG